MPDSEVYVIGGFFPFVPGSRQYQCSICKTAVWISPRFQDMADLQKVICMPCVGDWPDEAVNLMVTDEQVKKWSEMAGQSLTREQVRRAILRELRGTD